MYILRYTEETHQNTEISLQNIHVSVREGNQLHTIKA